MIELSAEYYQRVRPLFNPLGFNLAINSVLAGNTPGQVFADDPAEPHLALLWNRQDALFLAGLPGLDPDISQLQWVEEVIRRTIIPDARQRYIPHLSIQWFPVDLQTRLPDVLTDWQPEKAYRRLYLYKQIGVDYRHGLLPGYTVERISQRTLQSDLLNRDQVLGWIESFWASPEIFLERGFGYCVFTNDVITSWCLTVFNYGNRFELGVATAERYRQQGLASLAVALCLEYCLLNDLIPEWHCWENNIPSIKLAEKVGFEQRLSYPAYQLQTGLTYSG